jgi:hypothetical protein
MPVKRGHISLLKKIEAKKRLVNAIAKKAFWSYPEIAAAKVPYDKLIEKVLIHGSDAQRRELLEIFPKSKIQGVWEGKLVVQEPRLHGLNRKIARFILGIPNPEGYIQESYKKHNLYDRFSAQNA